MKAIMLGFACVFAGCYAEKIGDSEDSDGESSADSGVSLDSAATASGADVYQATCAGCHGQDGKLGVEISGQPAADLTVEIPSKTDNQIAHVVQDGYETMPGQSVTDIEVPGLLAYLRRTFPSDADGDGYAVDEDCDDGDALIHPGAEEVAGDGIDSNCDGEDDI